MPKTQHDHANLGGSNKILNLEHAAEILDIEDPTKLRRSYKAWGIPAFKVGREIRFVERDLRAWVAKQQRVA